MSDQTNPQPPVEGSTLLQHLIECISFYLHCSEHQRLVLALWVLHTYCLDAAQTTPYLAIQSIRKQSGKTRCLQLLNALCDLPAFSAGFTASNLTHRLNPGSASALLLDECQGILGTRTHPKGPILRGLLTAGHQRGPGYTDATHERSLFCPKAFAGSGFLPEEIADRSLFIILEPVPPDVPIARFRDRLVSQQIQSLRTRLRSWSTENLPRLKELLPYEEQDYPSSLYQRRRQDLCEPLLQIADTIGGDWPARARKALLTLFEEAENFHLHPNLRLLEDIHAFFCSLCYPERVASAELLDWLHMFSDRPWAAEGPLTAYKLSRLLAPFEIRARLQRIGKKDPCRGYDINDFLESWQRYFKFKVPGRTPGVPIHCPEPPPWFLDIVFKNSDRPKAEPEIEDPACPGEPRIVNNGAVCNGLPLDAQKAGLADGQAEARVAPAPPPVSAPEARASVPHDAVEGGASSSQANSLGTKAKGQRPKARGWLATPLKKSREWRDL